MPAMGMFRSSSAVVPASPSEVHPCEPKAIGEFFCASTRQRLSFLW